MSKTKILFRMKSFQSVELFKTKIYKFFKVYDMGLVLPRRRPYTVFDEKFLEQTGLLFNVFYYSKDLPTLFENIIWARENVNEMMFIHALTLTVFHRSELKSIVLPPLYEIIPNHFFNYEVLQKGIDYKMNGLYKLNSTFTLTTDYTSRYYLDKFQEQRVSYFTEDIGINSFYYYFYMRYPLHLGGKEVFSLDKEPVGELWLWMHQQLLARYYLERISNDLGAIPDFLWVKGIKNGYWPMLRYKNGMEFAYRSNYYGYESMDKDLLQNVVDWELRIKGLIDHGMITLGETTISIKDNDFINKLGLILLGDVKDVRFYRYLIVFYHMLAGGRGAVKQDPYFITPSVLEHFETCLRDPVFWQLYKRVIKYWLQYKDILPHYVVKDLYVPVKIENVIVSPLKTYFEYDEVDVTNAVDIDLLEKDHKFLFKVRQPRLNYEPFDVTLNVDVETAGEYTVRFFLGPKVLNRYELNDVRQHFFELDHFIYDFKAGKNTILRKSREFLYFFKDLVKLGGGEYLTQYGFPMNLLLPKGKIGGMPFTFYVIVHKNDFKQQLGFPFDRKINYYDFFVPNMYFKDVIISQLADMDVHSDIPLNNIYYNKVIPMHSIRVPLNVEYYTQGKLDDVFVHTSDIYNTVWYMKYLKMGKYGRLPKIYNTAESRFDRYGKVILDKPVYNHERPIYHEREEVIPGNRYFDRDVVGKDWIKY